MWWSSLNNTMFRKSCHEYPSRIEGWLNICDKETLVITQPSGRWREQRPQPKWQPHYCVLMQDDRTFTHYLTEEMSIGDRALVDLPRTRLDGGRQAFRRRWGYDVSGPPPLPEEDEDSELSETTSLRDERLLRFSPMESTEDGVNSRRHTIGVGLPEDRQFVLTESSYEKACNGNQQDRRGSAPTTPILGPRNMDGSTPSRFVNFFSKRSFKNNPLKRTKSVTKLERKRCTIDGDSVLPSKLRTSRSHESLLQSSPGALASLDLSHGDVQVATLHSSLLNQDHCFQLSSSGGTRYYTCRTAEERDRWVYSLRRTIHPNQDNMRRMENTLRIWILEAKGVAAKKRYFCELCLDKTLYARTSTKQKAEICFWGENFEFNNLPKLEAININLYREADKKKRRDKNTLIGSVNIPINTVNSRHFTEKWYPVNTEKLNGGKDCPALRIKSRHQAIDILPLVAYKEFLQYVKTEYKTLCEMLEPVISVRTKEDIAMTIIHIMQKEGMAKQFLADVVMADVDKIDDQHLTFRGNSVATKAVEAYMKLLGEKYLQDTLSEFVATVLESSDDCEVDPMKVPNNVTLQKQQSNLMTGVEMAWTKIINSYAYFPLELREVFHSYRNRLTALGKEGLSDNLISASIFLRFLCPAILSPSLFNLTHEYPQSRNGRTLTLIAKTIQTLANFTKFGGKESFMEFMNEFVEREWATMKMFLRQISSPVSKEQHQRHMEFDGYIDKGRELATLHGLLSECLPRINKKVYFEEVERLQKILDGISAQMSQPLMRQHSQPPPLQVERNRVTPDDKGSRDADNASPNGETRSSTLPCRNVYLLGSGKRPARDLTTADDYVLFSALDGELDRTRELVEKGQRCRDTVYVRDTRLTQSCIYGEIGAPHGAVKQQQSQRNTNNSDKKRKKETSLSSGGGGADHTSMDEDTANSSGELEYPVIRGSQISISQLSTMASSGYQSIAYSQSSSPVDPTIHQDKVNGNATTTTLPPPLAFNNPMYHFNTPNVKEKSPTGSVGSRSVEDVSILGAKPCNGISRNSKACSCFTSSSSSDNLSSSSSPPRDRRSTCFKSGAPRTNPRYSSSQPSIAVLCNDVNGKTGQQRLAVFATPVRHCHHHHHHGSAKCTESEAQWRQRLLRRTSVESLLTTADKRSYVEDDWDSDPRDNSYTKERPLRRRGRCKVKNDTTRETSVVQQGNKQKSPDEYEEEVERLKRLMQEMELKLKNAEHKLNQQETTAEKVLADWKSQLEAGEERLRKQQEEKDHQMKNIITRLITVEEELRKEQQEMQGVIAAKQKVIDAQERRIQTLDAANSRLMGTLAQMKDRYQGRNGGTKMALLENGEAGYKSSSC